MYLQNEHTVMARADFAMNTAGILGGGLYMNEAADQLGVTPNEILDTVFETNVSRSGGGAYIDRSELIVRDTRFINNTAGQYGGGLSNSHYARDLFIERSVFEGNQAGFSGGGLYMDEQSGAYPALDVLDSTFIQNTAGLWGGAVTIDDVGRADFERDIFLENSATSTASRGGALYTTKNESIEVTDSFFCNNNANQGSVTTSINTIISERWENNILIANDATTRAGLVLNSNQGAVFTVASSTFLENEAFSPTTGRAAALSFSDDSAGAGFWDVQDNIFAYNRAQMVIDGSTANMPALTFINSLFWSNTVSVGLVGGFYGPGAIVGSPTTIDPGITVLSSPCTGYTVADLTSSAAGYGADPSLVPLP